LSSKVLQGIIEEIQYGKLQRSFHSNSHWMLFSADETGVDVDQTKFRQLIGSLLYLTASRPDIMFSVCLCARFQAKPKESHYMAAKRILKYLKGTIEVGLWYPSEVT